MKQNKILTSTEAQIENVRKAQMEYIQKLNNLTYCFSKTDKKSKG